MSRAYMNWSGGKDSSLCLYRALQSGRLAVDYLLTSVNTFHNRISMHGVRRALLEAQADSIRIPLQTVELPEEPGMAEYERVMTEKVQFLKNRGCTHAIFGDIFLEDLKRYREEQLKGLGIRCEFPLWQLSTRQLVSDFIREGFKAIIVCVNERYLDKHFCGRLIDETLLDDLPENVDPCGENGEYHSFVFEGPIFTYPIPFTKGEVVYRQYQAPVDAGEPQAGQYGFYFLDLL